jgi:putative endonuclease
LKHASTPTDETRGRLTRGYNVTVLVHVEQFVDPNEAIVREKQLKDWSRAKKIALIERANPEWRDLAQDWLSGDATLDERK